MSEKISEEYIVMNDDPIKLKPAKAIKFFGAFSLIFGMIIGCGIFIAVGNTFEVFESNSIGMVLIFWIFGGFVALSGGLCYSELGTRIPESGGERAYYKHILNEKFSVIFVIMYIFLVKGITLAALALTSGSYITGIFTENPDVVKYLERLLAAFVLLSCFFVNCISKNIATYTNIFFTIMKMIAIVLIISFGVYYLATDKHEEWDKPFAVTGFSIMKMAVCFINIFWSFEGWNTLGMVVGDLKNPRRDLPLAVITGISAVTLCYILANVSYSAILGYDVVRNSTTIAASFSKIALKKASPIIPILICCSAAGAINGTFFSTGCVIMSSGFKGELAKIFSLVHKRQRTPIIGLCIMLAISLLFLTFDFQKLLMYSSFISWTFYFLSLCCLLKLKFSKNETKSTDNFCVPTFLIFPIQLVCLFTVFMCFYLSPIGCGVFAGIGAICFIILYIPPRFRSFSIVSKSHDRVAHFLTEKLFLDYAMENDVS